MVGFAVDSLPFSRSVCGTDSSFSHNSGLTRHHIDLCSIVDIFPKAASSRFAAFRSVRVELHGTASSLSHNSGLTRHHIDLCSIVDIFPKAASSRFAAFRSVRVELHGTDSSLSHNSGLTRHHIDLCSIVDILPKAASSRFAAFQSVRVELHGADSHLSQYSGLTRHHIDLCSTVDFFPKAACKYLPHAQYTLPIYQYSEQSGHCILEMISYTSKHSVFPVLRIDSFEFSLNGLNVFGSFLSLPSAIRDLCVSNWWIFLLTVSLRLSSCF